MKLVIDYRLASYSLRGMARYCQEITKELATCLPKDWEIVLYVDRKCNIKMIPLGWRYRILPTKNYIIGEQFWIPYYLIKDNADILWSPANTFPLWIPKRIKYYATIHDLIFLNKLEGKETKVQKIGRLYRRLIINRGIKKIKGCCTVSEYTAQELRRTYGLNKVVLTYNCVDNFVKKVSEINKIKKYKRGDSFFTVSGDSPSKNLILLFDWFSHHPDYSLNVAGLPHNTTFKDICPANITILPQNLSEDIIINNYLTCRAFLFVSKKEGFGLPPLEAMVCGCKLIISNRTSIPEVVGENGIYINPDNFNELTEAITGIDDFQIDPVRLQKQIYKYNSWRISATNLADLLMCK